MKLFIKNMVCLRCKIVVEEVLYKVGLHAVNIELGQVEIKGQLSQEQSKQFNNALMKVGLQLVDNPKYILAEKIKTAIVERVHNDEEGLDSNLSAYLSNKLNYDYTYLANQFSAIQGTTIEQFYIVHKIERVKLLLNFDKTTLTEIAWQMQYSSVAHLSAQFKKVTGFTPSQYRQARRKSLVSAENV